MELTTLQDILTTAIKRVLAKDSCLLENSLHEGSIAFRLGLYLHEALDESEYIVDMEYNKNLIMGGLKRVPIDGELDEVRPDLIVHKRGTSSNMLAIEVKKSSNRTGQERDQKKIKGYLQQLGYQYGLTILFRTHDRLADLEWHRQGLQDVIVSTIQLSHDELRELG